VSNSHYAEELHASARCVVNHENNYVSKLTWSRNWCDGGCRLTSVALFASVSFTYWCYVDWCAVSSIATFVAEAEVLTDVLVDVIKSFEDVCACCIVQQILTLALVVRLHLREGCRVLWWVCLSVCLSACITGKLHCGMSPNFSACYLWPLLGYLAVLR